MKKEVVVVGVVATLATITATAVLVRRWRSSSENRWRRTQRILRTLASQCATPLSKLEQIADELVVDMKSGLAYSDGRSRLPMIISYVDSLPTGYEGGIYYGLNLSGTEFRASRIQLGGKTARIVNQESISIPIPQHLSVQSSHQEVFDYIAMEVGKFFSTSNENFPALTQGQNKKLGFTYSFPVDEDTTSLESGIKWKKFSINDPEGKAMVDDMNRALETHGVNMQVSAMVDETVGNLVGDRCYNTEVVAAVTLAMGTNAAYIEQKSAVSKWNDPSTTSAEMVIDVEWGSFNSSNLPLTKEFDVCLDAKSSNPGEQIFEKLISGMYLGEIVRLVLLKMAKETALFGDNVPPKLSNPYVLRSPDMAAMHQDTSEGREVVGEKLKEFFEITVSTPVVREVVADVCDIVVERAARLAGAGIVSILKKLDRTDATQKSVVTVEGGLYQHYRLFRNYLHSCVWEMLGSSENVVIENSNGGSGIGAVFLAVSNSKPIQESTPPSS
ncbi:hypothetical protein MKX01_015826 [Papaver californicum]|nr:hypothetical protein MKX01_015826 [Papaver californicum]